MWVLVINKAKDRAEYNYYTHKPKNLKNVLKDRSRPMTNITAKM